MNGIHGELARFVVVGVGSNLLNFLFYFLTHALGAPLVVASVTGYLIGLLNSFWYGKSWVFGDRDRINGKAIFRFVVVYAIGGIGMSAIIEILDRTQGLDYRVSWFFGAAFAFTNNFLGSKWLVFKVRKKHNGN